MEWKLVDVEQVTHNRFLNYFVMHYLVEGKEYSYYLASRMSKENLRVYHEIKDYRPDGVIMVLVKKEGDKQQVAIIEEYRPCFGKYVTSLPAGLLDKGETILEAAAREAREEIGVNVKNLRLLFPGSPTTEGMTDEMVGAVYGEIDGFVGQETEFAEDISWKLYDDEQIRKMLSDPNRLMPVPTRLALLLAINHVELP